MVTWAELPLSKPQTIAQLTADTVIMDKRQTSHTSQSMAKRLWQVQLDEQSNPLFDSKPFSPTTIRNYSQQIAPVAEKGGVNTNSMAAALVDLRNFISAAAVSGAALAGVYIELLFNTDVVKLNWKIKPLYGTLATSLKGTGSHWFR